MNLQWSIRPRDALDPAHVAAMLRIHRSLYASVDEDRFRAHLAEKHEVVLLEEPGGTVRGYTTLSVDRDASGRWVLFSGDTGVERSAWGSPALAVGWLAAAMRWRDRLPQLDWLLLAGGPRTYRYLPLFFDEHWPRPDRATPPEVEDRLAALARERWGDAFRGGVVRLGEPPLRPEHDQVREDDARDRFFRAANPGWTRGDELVCLTRVDRDNLTRAGRRILRGVPA